jgi:NTE family protein
MNHVLNLNTIMNSIGLVLSGGGIRGIAHLGVLKLIDELEIQISAVSGTSAGSLIGAFYAAGFKPDEIVEIAKSNKFFGYSNFLIGKAGLFDMKPFDSIFHQYFDDDLIENLNIPIYITATDIVKGESVVFSKGSISMALMASCCIPLVFKPIEYDGKVLLDGGILDNFPIAPLLGKTDKLIGVHVNSLSKKIDQMNMKDMLDRSFHLALNSQLIHKKDKCDVFIEPPEMSRFGLFDMSNIDEIYEFSYEFAKSEKDKIIQSLRE